MSTVSKAQNDQSSAQVASGEVERPEFKFDINREVLNAWLIALLALVEEARLIIGKPGIEVRAVDLHHVAMIETLFKKKAFESYKVSRAGELGISVSKFVNFLKVVPKDTMLTLVSATDGLKIEYEAGTFTLPYVDLTGLLDPHLPNVVTRGKIRLTFDTLVAMLIPLKSRDYVKFFFYPDELKIVGESKSDNIILDSKIKHEYLEYVRGKSLDIATLFPMDYLEILVIKSVRGSMGKLLKDQLIEINLESDQPITFGFEDKECYFKFMLAPRIDADTY